MTQLVAWSWPGNVRELENTIERAVTLGHGEMLMLEDLPERVKNVEVSVPSGADFRVYDIPDEGIPMEDWLDAYEVICSNSLLRKREAKRKKPRSYLA